MKLLRPLLLLAGLLAVAVASGPSTLVTETSPVPAPATAPTTPVPVNRPGNRCDRCHLMYTRCMKECQSHCDFCYGRCRIECRGKVCEDRFCMIECGYDDCFSGAGPSGEDAGEKEVDSAVEMSNNPQDDAEESLVERSEQIEPPSPGEEAHDDDPIDCPSCTHAMIDCVITCRLDPEECRRKCVAELCNYPVCHDQCGYEKACESMPAPPKYTAPVHSQD